MKVIISESQVKSITTNIEQYLNSYFSDNKYICEIMVQKEDAGWFHIIIVLNKKSLDELYRSDISVIAAATKKNVGSAFETFFPKMGFGITMYPKVCD